MDTTDTKTPRRPPSTVAELLDHEEALAIQRVTATAQRVGGHVCEALDLRARVRAHPFLAVGAATLVGFAAAPFLVRLARRALTAKSPAASAASAATPGLPGWLRAPLAAARALR